MVNLIVRKSGFIEDMKWSQHFITSFKASVNNSRTTLGVDTTPRLCDYLHLSLSKKYIVGEFQDGWLTMLCTWISFASVYIKEWGHLCQAALGKSEFSFLVHKRILESSDPFNGMYINYLRMENHICLGRRL